MFAPVLILDGEGDGVTPYYVVPVHWASQAERVLRLAAVPLHIFRFIGPRMDQGFTYELPLIFTSSLYPANIAAVAQNRAVVLWSDTAYGLELVREALAAGAPLVLVVSESAQALDALQQTFASDARVSTVDVSGPGDLIAGDAPARIWSAYLNAIAVLFAVMKLDFPPMSPGLQHDVVSLEEWRAMAQEGVWSRTGLLWSAGRVDDDFVAAPARIMKAAASFRLAEFFYEGPLGAEAHNQAAQDAYDVLALRGISNLVLSIRNSRDTQPLRAFVDSEVPPEWADWLWKLALTDDQVSPPAEHPDRGFAAAAPPQVVLLCPATNPETARLFAGVSWIAGTKNVDDVLQREKAYTDLFFEAAGRGGRLRAMPQPQNEDQKQIALGFVQAMRGENQFISAIAPFYGTRFLAPVLKLESVGTDFLEPFQSINSVLEAAAMAPNALAERAAVEQLASTVDAAARHLSGAIPEAYRDFLLWLRDVTPSLPIVHLLSDYPLELAPLGDDYLGYQADLSRTPLTPASLLMHDYAISEATTVLPTRAEQFLLATALDEDDAFTGFLDDRPPHVPDFAQRVVRTKPDLLAAMADPAVECLVYFGHATWDRGAGLSALILGDDEVFTTRDLEKANRIPPLVVLIGCNTAAASTVLSGFHAHLCHHGAKLIVGTAFNVPTFIGVLFLRMFISNLLSPGVTLDDGEKHMYRDLAEIVATARRRIRFSATLFSLLEQHRITFEQSLQAQEEFLQRFAKVPKREHLYEVANTRLMREILTELSILPAPESSLLDIGVVPYPLFFQVIGFPWTNRSASWGR